MDEQKKNRLAAAVTVNVIILMVILVAVIIYQLVEIVGQNNEYKQLAREYEYYSRLLEDKKDELDFFESEQKSICLNWRSNSVIITPTN